MIEPAILSLRQVFRNVKIFEPELYARINTAGSLCVRHIRGRPGSVSTHAYGLSVDLNIDGKLDTLGDGKTQLGLILLADFFKSYSQQRELRKRQGNSKGLLSPEWLPGI